MKLLTVIVLLPLAGFLLNGLLGKRMGRTFVSVVGCGLPILAFLATLRAFAHLQAAGPDQLLHRARGSAESGSQEKQRDGQQVQPPAAEEV